MHELPVEERGAERPPRDGRDQPDQEYYLQLVVEGEPGKEEIGVRVRKVTKIEVAKFAIKLQGWANETAGPRKVA